MLHEMELSDNTKKNGDLKNGRQILSICECMFMSTTFLSSETISNWNVTCAIELPMFSHRVCMSNFERGISWLPNQSNANRLPPVSNNTQTYIENVKQNKLSKMDLIERFSVNVLLGEHSWQHYGQPQTQVNKPSKKKKNEIQANSKRLH